VGVFKNLKDHCHFNGTVQLKVYYQKQNVCICFLVNKVDTCVLIFALPTQRRDRFSTS